MTRKRLVVVVLAVLVLAVWAGSCLMVEERGSPATVERPVIPEAAGGKEAERAPVERRSREHASSGDVEPAPPPESGRVAGPAGDDPADSAAAPEEVELVVTVRDAAGRGVAGVGVRAARPGRFPTTLMSGPPPTLAEPPSTSDKRTSHTTDVAGLSRILTPRHDRLRVMAESDSWIGEVVVVPGADEGPIATTLTVVPAFRLAGRVVHGDGTPVKGARVYIAVPLPGRASRMPRRLEVLSADGEGRFSSGVHAVPDTRIVECYVMAGSIAGTSHRFPVTAGARDDLELVAQHRTVIRGRCVDERGEPLGGVRVRGIMPQTGEITMSGPDGRFAMPVPGNGGGLIFFLDGRVQTALRDLRGPPEGADVGDVLIPAGGTIAGRIVEADGTPIVGVEVLIVDPWSRHAAARLKSDASGAFRSDDIGTETHYVLAAVKRADDPMGLHCYFRFDGLRAGDTDVTLTVPRGRWVEVVVHDRTNDEPLAFEKGVFTLIRDDGSEFAPVHRVFETAGETRHSFMVQVPEPGTWVFEMELPVSGRVDRRAVVVGETDPAPVVLTPR